MRDKKERDRLDANTCPMTSKASAAFEYFPDRETVEIDEIARLTTELQDKRIHLPEQKGSVLRGVHPKSHGCVSALFVINEDIDKQYQVGLFSEPGATYDAHIRFSNAAVEIASDSKFVSGSQANPAKWEHGSRGMAVKVCNVDGDIIDEDFDGQKNQDFLMINQPEFAFSDVHSYLFLTRTLFQSEFGTDPTALFALGKITLDVIMKGRGATSPVPTQVDFDALKGFLASSQNQANFKLPEGFLLQDLKKVIATLIIVAGKIQKQVVRNPLQVQYFGASPYLLGNERVMKFSAAPTVLVPQEDFDTSPPEPVGDNFLREALSQAMKDKANISFDFKILVRDGDFGENQILIEDATTTWKKDGTEEIGQYVNVAKLIIKTKQNISSKKAIKRCESLVFTPWHALKEHKPIGGINRLRRAVYDNSAKHRQKEAVKAVPKRL